MDILGLQFDTCLITQLKILSPYRVDWEVFYIFSSVSTINTYEGFFMGD